MIYFLIFAVSILIVYLITPNIRYLALRFYAIDRKNGRKIHKKIVTKLGGISIYCGFIGGLVVATIYDKLFLTNHLVDFAGLIIGATLVFILGLYDDLQGSNASTKFITQIVIAMLITKTGLKIENITIPNLINVSLGQFSIPFTILWLVGIINAINLLDGLDGLAAGVIAIANLFFCIYGIILGDLFVIFVSLATAGSALAFLRYNFYPAKIFMGDTGSLLLGFIVGSLSLYKPVGNKVNLLFLPSIILLFLPILDTNMAIARRIIRKQHVFRSDSSHIHHYYIKLGFSQSQTAIRFYIMTFLLGISSLVLLYKVLN